MPGRRFFSSFRKTAPIDPAKINAATESLIALFSKYYEGKEFGAVLYNKPSIQQMIISSREDYTKSIADLKTNVAKLTEKSNNAFRDGDETSYSFAITLLREAIRNKQIEQSQPAGHYLKLQIRRGKIGFEKEFASKVEEFLTNNAWIGLKYNKELGTETSHAYMNMLKILDQIELKAALATAQKDASEKTPDRAHTDKSDASTATAHSTNSKPPKLR
jgi:hypothetical protein